MKKGKNRNIAKRREAKKQKRKQQAKKRIKVTADNRHSIGFFEHDEYAFDPKKLSSLLLEYAEPLLEDADDDNKRYNAISMSIIFWNASTSYDNLEDANEMVVSTLEPSNGDLSDEYKDALLSIFEMMYTRKKLFYADDKRLVVDFDIKIDNDNISLHIASAILSEE